MTGYTIEDSSILVWILSEEFIFLAAVKSQPLWLVLKLVFISLLKNDL